MTTSKNHRNARKTHCKRGHEFTEANIYRTVTGRRQCRTCKRAYEKNWRDAGKTNLDVQAVAMRKYRQTSRGKRRQAEWNKAYRQRHPERINAANALRRAVRRGRMIRPKDCSSCFALCEVEGHHPDYSTPLEVEWLCQRCHLSRHGKVLRAIQ